jgi:hypothetical protein
LTEAIPGPAVGAPSLNDASSAEDEEVAGVLSTTTVVVVVLVVVGRTVVGAAVVEVVVDVGRAPAAGFTVVVGRVVVGRVVVGRVVVGRVVVGREPAGAGAGTGDLRTTWTVATTWATVEGRRAGGVVVGGVLAAGRPPRDGWFGLGAGRPAVPAPAMGATRISTTVMAMTVRRAKAARMVAAVRFTVSDVGPNRRGLERLFPKSSSRSTSRSVGTTTSCGV